MLRQELALRHKDAGPIPTTITYDEYRDIGHGVHLPMRFTIANPFRGEMVAQVKHAHINFALPADAFRSPVKTGTR